MVRKFLPVFFLLFTSAVFSESPWGSSIQKGFEAAKQDKKFIVVDVFADWCTYCLVLEKEIFPDPEVSRVLESFVKVRLDGEEFPNLRKKYSIEGYPTILFLDGDGNYVTKISGLATKEDILGVSKRILQEPNLESYLKTELRRNTNSPDIHFRLGLLYFQNKEFEKAEQQFSDAVLKSKNQTTLKENAHFNLNLVRSIHGPKESAVKSWKEFLDTYPTSSRRTTAKLYYGLTLKDVGETKLAKVVLMEIKPKLTTETDKSMCNEALSEIERGF